jgi:hypothetical protein
LQTLSRTKGALVLAALLASFSIPVRADLIDLIADFNSIADGGNNASVQTYFNNLLSGSGASVAVSGAKGEANYDGDGHVVGPCTLTGSYTNCWGSGTSHNTTGTGKPYVTPLTLGTSDGANMGDTPRVLGSQGFLDTFLIPDGNYKKGGKNAIKFAFTNIPFLVTQVEFDFEILPSVSCTSFPCSNLPDFTFYVDGIQVLYQLAITPPVGNRESRCTDGSSYTAPFSPNPASCNPPSGYETVPQWIGKTGLINLAAIPGFNVNSHNHTFEFVDWPEMVGIDNFNMPREVPEPSTLLLLGTGLAGIWLKRKRNR